MPSIYEYDTITLANCCLGRDKIVIAYFSETYQVTKSAPGTNFTHKAISRPTPSIIRLSTNQQLGI